MTTEDRNAPGRSALSSGQLSNPPGMDKEQGWGRDWPLPPPSNVLRNLDTSRVLDMAVRVSGLSITQDLHSALLNFTRAHSQPDQLKEFLTDLLRIVEKSAQVSPARETTKTKRAQSAKPAPRPTPAAIRTARTAARLTQTEAAQRIGVSMRTWQQWESGSRRMHPGLMELFKSKTEGFAIPDGIPLPEDIEALGWPVFAAQRSK